MTEEVVVDDECLRLLRATCLQLPGVDEGVLQDRPLFRVGRRRFAIFNAATSPPRPRWKDSGRSLHFVTDPLEYEALVQDERFTKSPHHGDRGWLSLRIEDPEILDSAELVELLETAHRHVAPRSLLEG